MENPLAAYMNQLIEKSPEKIATAQLVMTNGQTLSGALRRSDVPGVYEIGLVAKATQDTPGALRPGQEMVVSVAFTAEAVHQVIQFAGHAESSKLIV